MPPGEPRGPNRRHAGAGAEGTLVPKRTHLGLSHQGRGLLLGALCGSFNDDSDDPDVPAAKFRMPGRHGSEMAGPPAVSASMRWLQGKSTLRKQAVAGHSGAGASAGSLPWQNQTSTQTLQKSLLATVFRYIAASVVIAAY